MLGRARAGAALCLWLLSMAANAQSQFPANDLGITVINGAPFVELYVQPGRGFPRFHAVEKHEQLRITKSRNNWFKVETQDGKSGWARKRDLHSLLDLDGKPLDFASPAIGGNHHRWQAGLMGGQMEGINAYTAYLGYQLTSNISAELKYSQAFGVRTNTTLTGLQLVHQAAPRWRVSPFFSLGAGSLTTSPQTYLMQSEDRTDTAFTLGGGLLAHITHRVLARLEYNKHTVLTTHESNQEVEEWKAGFSVLF